MRPGLINIVTHISSDNGTTAMPVLSYGLTLNMMTEYSGPRTRSLVDINILKFEMPNPLPRERGMLHYWLSACSAYWSWSVQPRAQLSRWTTSCEQCPHGLPTGCIISWINQSQSVLNIRPYSSYSGIHFRYIKRVCFTTPEFCLYHLYHSCIQNITIC